MRHYFETVLERWKSAGGPVFEDEDGSRLGLEKEFGALSVYESTFQQRTFEPPLAAQQKLLAQLLHHTRKVREALVARGACDAFYEQVYMFAIRAGIFLQDAEYYHPALQRMLRTIERGSDIQQEHVVECMRYDVLDTVGRRGNVEAAVRLAFRPGQEKPMRSIRRLLKASIRGDWVSFHQAKRVSSALERVLLKQLESQMARQAAACLTQGYFNAEEAFVVRCLDMPVDRCMKEHGEARGWTVEDGRVVFRRPKTR